MSKSQKAWIVSGIVLLVLILPITVLAFLIFKDDISLALDAQKAMRQAKLEAVEYIENKYGERDRVLSAEVIYSGGGFMGGDRRVSAVEVHFDDYTVIASKENFFDDRQYDEICSALLDKYFDDDGLGSSFTGNLYVTFLESCNIGSGHYTSVFFDGDIKKFVKAAQLTLHANYTYMGYPEKSGEYRKLLNDKFKEMYGLFGSDGLDVTIFIKDPNMELPEMPHKAINEHHIYKMPRYEEYMELIACGRTDSHRRDEYMEYVRIFHTEFYEIDEYTAISDDSNPIVSDHVVTFQPTDLSDNTTVYGGVYRNGDPAEWSVLTTRDEGWLVDVAHLRWDSIFLRLDREHYGITDTTIPLIVNDLNVRSYEDFDTWETHRFFMTVGYSYKEGVVDTNYMDWYYLDDDYLYLWIDSNHADLGTYFGGDGIIVTFSDIDR